jgi:hypothetical protein
MAEFDAKTVAEIDPSGTWDPAEAGSMPHAAPVDDVELVEVFPAAGKGTETAQALLDAAGPDREHEIKTSDGNFLVPADIAKKAKLPEADVEEDTGAAPAAAAPAKRTAAKR